MIDNFDILKKNLTFETSFDRYIVHVLKRAKDDLGKTYGVNETNRLLKTFYISSAEYLERKIPVIKDLCESNRARAYILPQVRDNSACLRNLLKVVVDNLDNPTIKPDHLIRTAFCGYHGSRDKKWILDLDDDNMVEFIRPEKNADKIRWKPKDVLEFVGRRLEECGKKASSAYMVPTRNGHCLVTPPFDVRKAYEKCNMMFEGVKKVSNPKISSDSFEVHGWLIKDGMALMYLPESIGNKS